MGQSQSLDTSVTSFDMSTRIFRMSGIKLVIFSADRIVFDADVETLAYTQRGYNSRERDLYISKHKNMVNKQIGHWIGSCLSAGLLVTVHTDDHSQDNGNVSKTGHYVFKGSERTRALMTNTLYEQALYLIDFEEGAILKTIEKAAHKYNLSVNEIAIVDSDPNVIRHVRKQGGLGILCATLGGFSIEC